MPRSRDFFAFDAVINPIAIGITYILANPHVWGDSRAPMTPQAWVAVAVVLAISLTWWLGAKRSEENRIEKEQKRGLTDQVISLASQLSGVMQNKPEDIESIINFVRLSDLSNEILRVRAITHAKKMREFEENYKNAMRLNYGQNINYSKLTDVERHKEWQKETKKLMETSNRHLTIFRNDYLPEALGLEIELLKRLKKERPDGDGKLVALEHGMLAGVSPASDAADYLEGMAREL